jgi:hypothetical protein
MGKDIVIPTGNAGRNFCLLIFEAIKNGLLLKNHAKK